MMNLVKVAMSAVYQSVLEETICFVIIRSINLRLQYLVSGLAILVKHLMLFLTAQLALEKHSLLITQHYNPSIKSSITKITHHIFGFRST